MTDKEEIQVKIHELKQKAAKMQRKGQGLDRQTD